ncbi:MAG TPA: hypothetical protein PJ982_14000, partial [Lacipirellulaceae bacterium]|nr:hypothetical protein [Lacipirellulaceae bacterium]
GVNGGATAAQADWDGNGVVDGADFLRWQRGLVPSMQAVPEPTSAACALVVTLLLAIPRGAQRQAWSNAIRT